MCLILPASFTGGTSDDYGCIRSPIPHGNVHAALFKDRPKQVDHTNFDLEWSCEADIHQDIAREDVQLPCASALLPHTCKPRFR